MEQECNARSETAFDETMQNIKQRSEQSETAFNETVQI